LLRYSDQAFPSYQAALEWSDLGVYLTAVGTKSASLIDKDDMLLREGSIELPVCEFGDD
jgi:hypothetical protein